MNRLFWLWLIGCLSAAAPRCGAQAAELPAVDPSRSTPPAAQRLPPGVGPTAKQSPHPAVVRVAAPGKDSVSYGSGCLVAVNELHGLVITNWHVINEATGLVTVEFPDGFESAATIQKIDRNWDLAALVIWKPPVGPAALARQAPRPGERLTIAGYGSGKYRAVSGECTQYVAPGITFPFEMVEVSVAARQGDSGGPIFNSRGELAGVLFGAADGRTSGSYCGRVQWFLDSVVGSRGLPVGDALIAKENGPVVKGGALDGRRAPVVGDGAPLIAKADSPRHTARVGQSIRSLGPLSAPPTQVRIEALARGTRAPLDATSQFDTAHPATSEPIARSDEDRSPADASRWRPIALADDSSGDNTSAGQAGSNPARATLTPAELGRAAPEEQVEPAAAHGPSQPDVDASRPYRPKQPQPTRWDQIKSFLAVVAMAGFLLWLARTLAASGGPGTGAERRGGEREAA